jgi:hypothetical protein
MRFQDYAPFCFIFCLLSYGGIIVALFTAGMVTMKQESDENSANGEILVAISVSSLITSLFGVPFGILYGMHYLKLRAQI